MHDTVTDIPSTTSTVPRPVDPNHGHYDWGTDGNRNDLGSGPSILFFSICGLLILCILYYFLHIYFLTGKPIYYTVIDHDDPTIHHLRRVVPFREWLRKRRGKPRSASDIFRDEDFERVQTILNTTGWRGPVNSNGAADMRSPEGRYHDYHDNTSGQPWGYNHNAEEHSTLQREPWAYDTDFWRNNSRDWSINYSTFSNASTAGSARNSTSNHRRREGSVEVHHSNAEDIPQSDTSSHHPSSQGNSSFPQYSTSAAYSYHPSPRGTSAITPPAQASRRLLGYDEYASTNAISPPRPLKFRNVQLSMHYDSLCATEALASMKLRRAKVRHEGPERLRPEVLRRLEQAFQEAAFKRAAFGERWSTESNLLPVDEERDASIIPTDQIPSEADLPPPYTEQDPYVGQGQS